LDAKRSKHELIVLDCTTIVPDLSGSELFGHVKGAFTGAIAPRDGAFAQADGGTLFLDEVGELPAEQQVQLLRVLQEQTYKRVGSNKWHESDFRLICATNRNLESEIDQAHFRRDLFYRIASWVIRLPPLRERTSDIIPLVKYFMRQVRPDEKLLELDERVLTYFLNRNYPGNVRDLRNLAIRIATRHVGPGPITLGEIPADERPGPGVEDWPEVWCDATVEQAIQRALANGTKLKEVGRTVEEAAIRIAVEGENGNLQRAADMLGVSDRTLQKWKAKQRQKTELTIRSNNGAHQE
jgi:transcriptional regulator with GAF, ATPase, and Fis domain